MKKLLFLVLLCAPALHAAGGTCPTGANYTNPANPNGSLVTLSSIGITNCYYVAASGSDSNTGTDETHPWLHAPHMPNCSGSCAVSLPAGTGVILRGGDTWHMGNSGLSPYTGGTWNFNSGSTSNGTAANPIYIGVDSTWFSGGSWVRPILTGDNPLTPNPNVVGDSVASCPFQVGTQNEFVVLDVRKFYIFDNFELTGLCQKTVGSPLHTDVFFSYAAPMDHLYFLNNYVHGDTHLAFFAFNGSPSCAGQLCFNISVFQGGGGGSGPDIIAKNVIDFTDSDPAASGLCKSGFADVYYNVFKGFSQCITVGAHLFHDNLVSNFIENGHSNVYESNNDADQVGTNANYNNLFIHLEDVNGQFAGHLNGGVGIWPSPANGSFAYFFNNLMYAVGNMEIFNVGSTGITTGQQYIFSNTFQANSGGSTAILRCDATSPHPFTSQNNHFIIDSGNAFTSPCSGRTEVTDLLQTNAQASAAGYNSSQTFAFSPTSAGSPTVAAGTAIATFCSALTTAAGSDSTLSDAAAACANDTRYACTYNQTNHTVSCPARTTVVRPTSGTPDIGAYELAGGLPSFSVVPSSFNYGNVNMGASLAQVFTVASGGPANLIMGTPPATITGTNAGDFTLQVIGSQCTNGQSLPQSSNCLEGVLFTPSQVGVRQAQLNIFNNASGSPQVIPLTGVGFTTQAMGVTISGAIIE